MLRNYVITALRNIIKNKLDALVNIGGLALGFSASILLILFVSSEIGYDSFWKDSEKTFRIETTMKRSGQAPAYSPQAPGPLQPLLDRNFPNEIKASTHFLYWPLGISKDELSFYEGVVVADADFNNVFDIEMIAGRAEDVFANSNSILVNETQAKRLFGSTSVTGEVISVNMGRRIDTVEFNIVGVMADLPKSTHMSIPYLTYLDPNRYLDQPWLLESWSSQNTYTYIKLFDGVDIDKLAIDFPAFIDRNFSSASALGSSVGPDVKASDLKEFSFMPVQDIHLYSSSAPQLKAGGDHVQIKILSSIAAAILFIAVINFTNLANARALRRLKEIAIRKILGAQRIQLIIQFLGEALVVSFIAFLVALLIAQSAQELFSDLVGKEVVIFALFEKANFVFMLSVVFFTGVLGSLYPAFILSHSRPIDLLLGKDQSKIEGRQLKFALIAVQFTISIALIIMTSIVLLQTNYINEREIGIKDENTLLLTGMNSREAQSVAGTFYNEIDRLADVVSHGAANRVIPLEGQHYASADMTHDNNNYQVNIEMIIGNYGLLETLDVELLSGRLFSNNYLGDLPVKDEKGDVVRGVVITEKTARSFGFNTLETAINQSFQYISSDGPLETMIIVGIIKDLNLRSAKTEEENIIFKLDERPPSVVFIKLSPTNQNEIIEKIEQIFTDLLPDQTFRGVMLDEVFQNFYTDDERQARVFGYSSLFSILISCVGLFGLAALTAEKQIREIGVRKVLGAQVWQIVILMMWRFSKPVLFANLVAWPIAWLTMADWLNSYIFRIDLTVMPFIMAGFLTIVIAWMTIGFHSVKLAKTRPIIALRHET